MAGRAGLATTLLLLLVALVTANPSSSSSHSTSPEWRHRFLVRDEAQNTTDECVGHTTCDNCTANTACVWCETRGECKEGKFHGPKGEILTGCTDWRWRQCKVNGRILFWGSLAGGLAVLGLFVMVGLCCCCCFMCRRRRRREQAEEREMDEIELLYEERRRARELKTKTSQRRIDFYKKHGRPMDDRSTLVNV